jgi:hypothetical protein
LPRAKPLLDALLEPNSLIAAYCNMDAVGKLVGQHLAGSHDGTDRIWNLLNLRIWGDIFLTGRRERWLNQGCLNERRPNEPAAALPSA